MPRAELSSAVANAPTVARVVTVALSSGRPTVPAAADDGLHMITTVHDLGPAVTTVVERCLDVRPGESVVDLRSLRAS